MIRLKELLHKSDSEIKKLKMGLKAENLVWMAKRGFLNRIPDFYVILPTECEIILENKKGFQQIIDNIHNFASDMNSKYFFVRSSAQLEDRWNIPSAGLFLSLGKIPIEDLDKTVIECISSTKEDKIKQILGLTPKTAIIVQNMIQSFSSGVLFTKHPLSNDKNRILIEAGYGLGETVVSGKFNTDHYEIDKKNLENVLKYDIKEKKSFVSSYSNSIEEVPNKLRMKPVLSNEQLTFLSRQAVALERMYGDQIDLEFSIDKNNKIWFLQLRNAQ